MKITRNLLLSIISFFGSGLISKKMPGTVASFFGSLVLIALPKSPFLIAILAILVFVIGVKTCDAYIVKHKYETDKDPKYVVIDEICGIFVGASIIYSFGLTSISDIAFNLLLFRLFDILKPFPIRNIERLMKQNERTVGLGIMLDDVLAGIISGILQIIIEVFGKL